MAKGKTCRAYPLESQVNSFHNGLELILKEHFYTLALSHKIIYKNLYFENFKIEKHVLSKREIKMIHKNDSSGLFSTDCTLAEIFFDKITISCAMLLYMHSL
jgi:hypothetical protein